MVRSRTGTAAVIAVLVVVAALAWGRIASAASVDGGFFVCDGFTGCYINGVLVNPSQECQGYLTDGPFHCTPSRTVEADLPTLNAVTAGAVCDIHQIRLGQPSLQIYWSNHGTVRVHQQGSTITFSANCPNG